MIAITYVIPNYFSAKCYADFVTQVFGYYKIFFKELLLNYGEHTVLKIQPKMRLELIIMRFKKLFHGI